MYLYVDVTNRFYHRLHWYMCFSFSFLDHYFSISSNIFDTVTMNMNDTNEQQQQQQQRENQEQSQEITSDIQYLPSTYSI